MHWSLWFDPHPCGQQPRRCTKALGGHIPVTTGAQLMLERLKSTSYIVPTTVAVTWRFPSGGILMVYIVPGWEEASPPFQMTFCTLKKKKSPKKVKFLLNKA